MIFRFGGYELDDDAFELGHDGAPVDDVTGAEPALT
jgi:hypothetical protein